MPPPGNSPFGPGLSRAVQSYAYSILRGGSVADAERAASLHHINPGDMPAVAIAARAAISAARALGARAEGDDYRYGGRQYTQYASAVDTATVPGTGQRTATVAVNYQPAGLDAAGNALPEAWTTIQVDVSGADTVLQAARIVEAAARAAAAAGVSQGAGVYLGFAVQTIIGH